MMKLNYLLTYLFIVVIIGLVSCKDNPVASPITTSDDILRSQIIGKWSNSPWYSNEYFPNGIFKSVSVIYHISPPYDTLISIRNGKYSIINGLLSYTEVHQTDTSIYKTWNGVSIGIFIPKEISIYRDSLTYVPVECLQLIQGISGQLQGTWTTTNWQSHVVTDNPIPVYEGRLKETYTFSADSFFVREERLDGQDPHISEYKGQYGYNDPFLLIDNYMTDTVKVSFCNNEMRWYFPKISFARVK